MGTVTVRPLFLDIRLPQAAHTAVLYSLRMVSIGYSRITFITTKAANVGSSLTTTFLTVRRIHPPAGLHWTLIDYSEEVKPRYFETPGSFRQWLERHHDTATELFVGFYKKDSGRPSITWPESVDEALCFGWIDGVRKRIDDESYSIRFTPRRKNSTWSAVNIARVAELSRLGKMQPAGVHAFELRREDKSAIYAYESGERNLAPAYETEFRSHRGAWKWFNEQAPSYRRVALHWVMSAKREETRQRRLATLIDDSKNKRRLAEYTLTPRRK